MQSKKDEKLTRTRHRRTPLQLRLVWPEESCALLSSCPYLSGDHVFIQSQASGGLWSPSCVREQWGGDFAAYGLFFGSIFFHACQISLTKGLAKESILAHFWHAKRKSTQVPTFFFLFLFIFVHVNIESIYFFQIVLPFWFFQAMA